MDRSNLSNDPALNKSQLDPSTSGSFHDMTAHDSMTAPPNNAAHHDPARPRGYFFDGAEDPHAAAFWSHFKSPHDLAAQHIPADSSPASAMKSYREYRDRVRKPVLATYTILGFLSSGTYGRVYKARLRTPPNSTAAIGFAGEKRKLGNLRQQQHASSPNNGTGSRHGTPKSAFEGGEGGISSPRNISSPGPGGGGLSSGSHIPASDPQVYAIKKFKPDSKDTDQSVYTGISQSAMREISLNRELKHINVVTLHQVMLEEKAIYMVFEYAEHDLLQIIHHHSTVLRVAISTPVLKSLLWQLINGVSYLHANWVLHRDLKPANILVTSQGVVKIGDLGLARLYSQPLQSLYNGDKVVVTIWYRAPELLLGARHYTTAIDMWSIGCIWGELLALRPMFKGEEAKMDPKTKAAPFQTDQLKRIVEVLGTPNKDRWPAIESMPDYKGWWPHLRLDNYPKTLSRWYSSRNKNEDGYDLFDLLLQYDPQKRLTADQALRHPWFTETEPKPTRNAFSSLAKPVGTYPNRRVIHDDLDPKMKSGWLPPIEAHHIPTQQQYPGTQQQQQAFSQPQSRQFQLLQQQSSAALRGNLPATTTMAPSNRHHNHHQQGQGQGQMSSAAPSVSASSTSYPMTAIGGFGGPPAPPPITINTGSALPIPFNTGTVSAAPTTANSNGAPAPAPGTVSAPGSVPSVQSVQSVVGSGGALAPEGSGGGYLQHPSTTTTTNLSASGTAKDRLIGNLVATATRNQQRKRQKI